MSDDVKQLLKVQLAKSERAAIDCEDTATRYLIQADDARASAQRARAFASELRKMLEQAQ